MLAIASYAIHYPNASIRSDTGGTAVIVVWQSPKKKRQYKQQREWKFIGSTKFEAPTFFSVLFFL